MQINAVRPELVEGCSMQINAVRPELVEGYMVSSVHDSTSSPRTEELIHVPLSFYQHLFYLHVIIHHRDA